MKAFKRKFNLSFSILLCLVFSVNGYAWQTETAPEPLWLLILPGTITPIAEKNLGNKVTDLVAETAVLSGGLVVFDRFGVADLLEKHLTNVRQALPDSVALAIGTEIECDELLILDILNFTQTGAPASNIGGQGALDYHKNVKTQLSVQFRFINLVTGEEVDRFPLSVSHTGGNKLQSENAALEKFLEVVSNEIQLIYQQMSEVEAVDGIDLELTRGSHHGLRKEMLVEIVQPTEIKVVDGEERLSPGKTVGLAYVENLDDSSNTSRLLREWDVIEPGYYARESYKHIQGVQVFYLPKLAGEYTYIGAQYHFSPLGLWDFGGGLHYSAIVDSYEETDHGFGLNAFGARRLFVLPNTLVYAKLGLNLDIPFKTDDDGQEVMTALFSGSLGLSFSYMLSKMSDFELNLGYRLSAKASDWQYNEEETEYDAYWEGDPPVVDVNGFYISVGYKFIIH